MLLKDTSARQPDLTYVLPDGFLHGILAGSIDGATESPVLSPPEIIGDSDELEELPPSKILVLAFIVVYNESEAKVCRSIYVK